MSKARSDRSESLTGDVMASLQRHGGACTVTEIANDIGESLPSVHSALRRLEHGDAVEHASKRIWRLHPEYYTLEEAHHALKGRR